MSELSPTTPSTNEADQKRQNTRLKAIGVVAASAILAAGTTLGVLRPWESDGATPAQARETIAGHKFDHPHIKSAIDTHEVVNGRATLEITLDVPTDSTAAAEMKQYAAKDSAVTWLTPSSLTSYKIDQDPKNKEYSLVGRGFALSSIPAILYGEAFTVTDGTAHITEHPYDNDRVGTKIALYAGTEAMTSNPQDLTITDGEQYLGTVEKTAKGWEPMHDQPQLPDRIHTTVSPWQH